MFLDIQNLSYQHEKPPVVSRAQNRRKAIAKIAPEPTLHNNCIKTEYFSRKSQVIFPRVRFLGWGFYCDFPENTPSIKQTIFGCALQFQLQNNKAGRADVELFSALILSLFDSYYLLFAYDIIAPKPCTIVSQPEESIMIQRNHKFL